MAAIEQFNFGYFRYSFRMKDYQISAFFLITSKVFSNSCHFLRWETLSVDFQVL